MADECTHEGSEAAPLLDLPGQSGILCQSGDRLRQPGVRGIHDVPPPLR